VNVQDTLLNRDTMFFDGRWQRSTASETLTLISPVTEERIGEVPCASGEDIDRAVAAGRKAFDEGPWATLTPSERAAYLTRMAEIYERRAGEIAAVITEQMGCPIAFSRAVQAVTPRYLLSYYAALAETYAWEELRPGPAGDALIVREPVGVVAAIVPWNYPQVATMLKVAPALLAGCTVVLKPAPETPLDALLLAEIAEEAGLPAGVFNVVTAATAGGEHLVAHPGVDKVSFTGSVAAGRRVAELCGRDMRRATMELGGKSASVVLDDADLGAAAPWLAQSVFSNAGQTCGAQTRVVVSRSRQAELLERLETEAQNLTIGDPRDEITQLGPLAGARHRERVEGYMRIGCDEGARLVTGGDRPAALDCGYYVRPTIFADVDPGARIAQEEIFGPVLSVIPFDDEAQAVQIANHSIYGLSGSVWTDDVERGHAIARRMKTGNCMVNGARGGLDSPTGGFKLSGVGREFGPEGLTAFTETKAIGLPR